MDDRESAIGDCNPDKKNNLKKNNNNNNNNN